MRLFDLSNVPIQLVDVIHEMLLYDPAARLTTYQALAHSYFRDVEPRLRPYKAGLLPPMQAPITPAPSIDGTSRPSLPLAYNPMVVNPLSPPQSADMDVDAGIPRSMPSSHAHGPLAHAKPSFGIRSPAGDGDSIMSESEQSGYSVPVMPPPASYPGMYQNGAHHYAGQHAGMARSHSQQSSAYDQSLYDQSSVYSMPVAVTAPSDSTISPNMSQRSLGLDSPVVAPTPAPPAIPKGRRLGSLFGGSGASSVAAPSLSLKRSPSERSMADLAAPPSVPPAPLDSKKAKKEAERLAKEEAKAKRERDRLAAQARSRAVMNKNRAMMGQANATEISQPEFAGPAVPNVRPRLDKGKGRGVLTPGLPQIAEDSSRLKPMDAGRFRQRRRGDDDADVHSVSSNETGDDRRFSIASANTMNTMDSDPGPHRAPRALSHLARSPSHSSLGSASRLSVASSPQLGTVYRASTPASTTSSLDHQLIANMAGLNAGGAPGDWSTRPSLDSQPSSRIRSPSDPRYSPYHRPTLPGIEAFDFPPGTFMAPPGAHGPHHTPPPNQHDRNMSVSSGATSVLSGQSVPVSAVSHQSHPQQFGHPTLSGLPRPPHGHFGLNSSQPASPLSEAATPMLEDPSR